VSSPSVVGSGGTRLTLGADGARTSEVVWNDNPTSSATGEGLSTHCPGRHVPDIAGNADPQTGYQVLVDGQSAVIGGTSAVAPLYAAMAAVVRQV
jgi:kumamolisin